MPLGEERQECSVLLCGLGSAVSAEDSMARLNLPFALAVAIWGVVPSESFSIVPAGAPRHRSLVDFSRNTRKGCRLLLRAAPSKSTAVTESADYLANKEALKQVQSKQ